jgi:hypothetical protein
MEHKNETKECQNCKKDFTIESDDFSFYEKIKVPPPTFCPECRLIRRLIMRNERVLYKRKCDLCKEDKILVYPENDNKVYCRECFNGDDWDELDYGKDFDPNRTFFEQYIELFNCVPRLGIIKQGFSINSEYTNRVTDLKNCYLLFASANNEDCSYGWSNWDSKNCMDCANIYKSERCFECVDCYNCNNLKYSQECSACIDSYFLMNCRNCQNCFGCTNLRNKNYYIFNTQYTKEAYFEKIKEYNLSNKIDLKNIKEKVKKLFETTIVPAMVEFKSTNVSGNWIENSKNVQFSFGSSNVEDGKYIFIINGAKDVMDYTYWGRASELIYESTSVGIQCSQVFFSNESWNHLTRIEYCHDCFASADLFGCVGLKNKQYCVLNKQYSKVDYFILVEKIKKQMIDRPFIDNVGRTIRYGEFFPSDMAPFVYNETIAQEYFSKTKEEVLKMGFKWKDLDKKSYIPTIMGNDLEGDIKDVTDSILDEIIGCTHKENCNHQCTMAFKIIPDELQFYRANNLPLSELCPNCRHYQRFSKRNPIKLWSRSCMKSGCNNTFETSYEPNRPEIVYCLDCYRKEVA